jgi:hypothetical protein
MPSVYQIEFGKHIMQKDLGSKFKKNPVSGQLPPEAVDANAHDHSRGISYCSSASFYLVVWIVRPFAEK